MSWKLCCATSIRTLPMILFPQESKSEFYRLECGVWANTGRMHIAIVKQATFSNFIFFHSSLFYKKKLTFGLYHKPLTNWTAASIWFGIMIGKACSPPSTIDRWASGKTSFSQSALDLRTIPSCSLWNMYTGKSQPMIKNQYGQYLLKVVDEIKETGNPNLD